MKKGEKDSLFDSRQSEIQETLTKFSTKSQEELQQRINNFHEELNNDISQASKDINANKSSIKDLKICTDKIIVCFKELAGKEEEKDGLTVSIYSFSYKKGIPADDSGNGGGYVFDCRGVHNPGRYDQYKPLTGLDKPVIDFLEENGEIFHFLEHIYALADAHVLRYMERGFTSLMFCFGCTGGQHRSVYSAQHLAEHIHDKFGIEVRICHREQKITTALSPAFPETGKEPI